MKGDFSKDNFDKSKQYTSVRMQQGRVQLDSDWNEQIDIFNHRIQVENTDFIGGSGTPIGNQGYNITLTTDKKNFNVSQGRYYVNGVLAENPKVASYTTQPDWPKAVLPTTAGLYLAYLDLWQRGVSAIEDPSIREVALSGTDTTTRVKNVTQVKLVKLATDPTGINLSCNTVINNTTSNKTIWDNTKAASTGQMTINVSSAANFSNQLYRVEIHDSGSESQATFKWSRDNGSVLASISKIDGDVLTFKSLHTQESDLEFKASQWVELNTRTRELHGKPGIFVQLLRVDNNTATVTSWPTLLDGKATTKTALATEFSTEGTMRRWDSVKTFVLKSNTASFLAISNFKKMGSDVTLDLPSVNDTSTFTVGEFVELRESISVPGVFVRLKSVSGKTLTLESGYPFIKIPNHIRAAGTAATTVSNTNNFVALEEGLEIKFSTGTYKTGDYWLIPTRATSIAEWPKTNNQFVVQRAKGIHHNYAPLFLLRLAANNTWTIAGDCRTVFSPLINRGVQVDAGANSASVVIDTNSNVGIGTSTPKNKLDVEGNAAIGTTYSGTNIAPANGLIVEGNVGIGTNKLTAGNKLEINGKTQTSSLQVRSNSDSQNDTVIVTQVWQEQQILQASDKKASDNFGYSVAISGNRAIVGAYLKDVGTSNTDEGAAYIFFWNGTAWIQQAKLQASDKEAGDSFGISVAINGDRAIVGAYLEDTGGVNAGSAYVFHWNGTAWIQQAKLQASDKQARDNFGFSVSINGDRAIVGAYREDTGGTDAGAAYVFHWNSTAWTQQAKLQASDKKAGDYFGISVVISGDRAIVGADNQDTGGTDAGAVYVFHWNGSQWIQQQKLQASDANAGDYFGRSVAISGDRMIVGAYGEDTDAINTNTGAAYAFHWNGTAWMQQAKLQASDKQANDYFGVSVTISGNWAIVGAYRKDAGSSGTDAGAAYIFYWNGGTAWTQQAKLQASDKKANDHFGVSVAISGEQAIVGAYRKDADSTNINTGAAYLWALQNSLGIGTNTPQNRLEAISNTSAPTIVAKNDGTGYAFYAPKGKIYAVNGVGAFTGVHEAIISHTALENIKQGMLLSVTGKIETHLLTTGKKALSSTLSTVNLSSVAQDTKVIGVFSNIETPMNDYWYTLKETEKLISFNALGDGLAWVSNINGDIKAGDYITTSQLPGYGMKQKDGLLHNYTLGKALEDVSWSKVTETTTLNGKSYKVYLIGIVYMSG